MAHAGGYLGEPWTRRRLLTGGVAAGATLWLGPRLLAEAAAPAGQVVRFTVFAEQPIKDLAYAPRPGAAVQKLQFFPTARSARQEYRGPMPLRFLDATTGAAVAEATVPPEIREALLLISPLEAAAAKGGLRYRIGVLDDSLGRHAPGALAIVNLSGLALTGTVGKESVALKAGLNPPVTIPRTVKVTFVTRHKERTYQSYADTVKLGPRQRALLILFPPFNKGSLEVQGRLLIDDPSAAGGAAPRPAAPAAKAPARP